MDVSTLVDLLGPVPGTPSKRLAFDDAYCRQNRIEHTVSEPRFYAHHRGGRTGLAPGRAFSRDT